MYPAPDASSGADSPKAAESKDADRSGPEPFFRADEPVKDWFAQITPGGF
jgi:hypothetical protein